MVENRVQIVSAPLFPVPAARADWMQSAAVPQASIAFRRPIRSVFAFFCAIWVPSSFLKNGGKKAVPDTMFVNRSETAFLPSPTFGRYQYTTFSQF